MQAIRSSRREVIKTFLALTVVSSLRGAEKTGLTLGEVRPLAHVTEGTLQVGFEQFPVLKQPFGSVRIGTSAISRNHFPTGLFHPVIINRGPSLGEYYAMSSACTHQECVVGKLDPESRVMTCPCHFSKFDMTGAVLQGPAGFPLRRFEITQTADALQVKIPELFHEVEVNAVAQLAPKRLAVRFLAFNQMVYEIFRKETLQAEPQQVPFSLTPTGPFDQASAPGIDDYLTVYLPAEGGSGFYQVAMQTKPV